MTPGDLKTVLRKFWSPRRNLDFGDGCGPQTDWTVIPVGAVVIVLSQPVIQELGAGATITRVHVLVESQDFNVWVDYLTKA